MPFSYYAVRIGRKSGIYPSWPECQTQTSDFKGAVFRGFNDLKHAQYYMETGHVPNEQRFYSVARGITPGIYTSWADASKQVTECRYSKYKRFDTLEDAQAYFTQHSRRKNPKPKLHQNPFQSYDNFTPNPTASFVDEFDRLASSQGWQPGTQAFKEHKVEALSAEIRRCFFTGVYRSVKKEPVATAMSDPVEQRETEGNARNNEPQIKQEPLELALDNEGAVDALDDWSDCKSDVSYQNVPSGSDVYSPLSRFPLTSVAHNYSHNKCHKKIQLTYPCPTKAGYWGGRTCVVQLGKTPVKLS